MLKCTIARAIIEAKEAWTITKRTSEFFGPFFYSEHDRRGNSEPPRLQPPRRPADLCDEPVGWAL
jgi:hypothetical protein